MCASLDALLFFIVIGFPHKNLIYDYSVPCTQSWTIVGVFLVVQNLSLAFSLAELLRNPFSDDAGTPGIRVDSLMASSDRCLFASIRGNFDGQTRLNDGIDTAAHLTA